jgi:HlyD family secretion protein
MVPQGFSGLDAIRNTAGQDVSIGPEHLRQKKRRQLLAAAVGALVVIASSIFVIDSFSSSNTVARRSDLRIATVRKGTFLRDVNAEGTVIAANSPTLVASASGNVVFHVVAGDKVVKGQKLLEVTSPELEYELAREQAMLSNLKYQSDLLAAEVRQQLMQSQQAIDQAAVRFKAAEREFKRIEQAVDSRVLPMRDFDRARDEFDEGQLLKLSAENVAKLQREALEIKVKVQRAEVTRQQLLVDDLARRVVELEIKSPVDGFVGNLLVAPSAAVAESTPLLTVVDLSAFEVEYRIPESAASDLQPGMIASISYNGQLFQGEITGVSPEVSQNEVRGRIRLSGDVPTSLRQNQRVSVRIVLDERKDVLMVERGAFVDEGSFAYVVEGDTAVRRPVKIGAMSVSQVELLSGVSANDSIIVSDVSEFRGAPQVTLGN